MNEPNIETFHGDTLSNQITALIASTRPAFLSASVLPVLAGFAQSWYLGGQFNNLLALATLLSVVFIHAGSNVLNDYFDDHNGSDAANTDRIFPFTGGSRFIQNGVHSASQTLTFGLALMAGGAGLGLWLVTLTGIPLLIIGLIGGLLAVIYSAPPCLACRGLGDLTIAVCFGVLPLMATVYIQTGHIEAQSAWVGLIVGWFAAGILWINSIPDITADRLANKMTLPARLGAQSSAVGLGILFALGFVLLLVAPLPAICNIAALAAIPAFFASRNAMRGQLEAAIPLTLMCHAALCVLLAVAFLLA